MVLRIYTDGACSGNPGPGGWGAILCLPGKNVRISGYVENTTNNRMELTAVLRSIETALDMVYQDKFKIKTLEIISDSAYVVNSLRRGWLERWNKNSFMTFEGECVKNSDLWKEMVRYLEILEFINVNIILTKVKGHNGNYYNEKVDKIARSEITRNLNRG